MLPLCWLAAGALPTGVAAKPAAAASALPAAGFLTLEQLRARYGDRDSRYVEIGGMSIRYKDQGRGPVIVLLHGSHSSLEGYDAMAKDLARTHRIIRFDMPGMGLSATLPASSASAVRFGDDVLAGLLDHLGIRTADLVGVSSGGAIAYHFAARYPARVTALVLSNTPADPVINANTPRSPELAAEFAEAARTGFRSRRYWSVYLRWLAADPDRVSPAKIDRYYDMNRRVAEKDSRYFWRATSNPAETQAALAGVKAPALLVWGLHDFVLPPATMGVLAGYLKAAPVSTIVLPDVGHYPPFEVPSRFADLTLSYLANVAHPARAE